MRRLTFIQKLQELHSDYDFREKVDLLNKNIFKISHC